MPANGSSPVFHQGAVLGLDVQSVGAESRGSDGIIPTSEVLQNIIFGDAGEGTKLFLRWSATKLLSKRSYGIYDYLFSYHGLSFR